MLRIGEARVEVEDGEIRNGFETLGLGKKFEVVVPTLVLVSDEATPMFSLEVERLAERSRQLRIIAKCICETCDQTHLVDTNGHQATSFFRPKNGLRLKDSEMPSVLPHSFGLIMMMMGDVPKLWDEVHADETVGLVVPSRK